MSHQREKKRRSPIPGVAVAVLFGLYALAEFTGWLDPKLPQAAPVPHATGAGVPAGTRAILEAFRDRRSNVAVEVGGTVDRVLADDDDGSRHQRLVVRLDGSGHTVLIAHNIDLAPRVPAQKGDAVTFRGEFEWNDRGGVVHWTHRDPAGRHADGFVRLGSETYR